MFQLRADGLVAVALATGACSGSAIAQAANAAERVRWLGKNTVAIRSVDPNDTDFRDLMPLVQSIGKARIVGLGEATHGDGAMFEAKVRLIKFLHQVMGFDVLVFESCVYGCSRVDAALRTDEPIEKVGRKGLIQFWSDSAQVRPLLEYVRRSQHTARPMSVAGMDVVRADGAELALGQHVRALFARAKENEPLQRLGRTFESHCRLLSTQPGKVFDKVDRLTLQKTIAAIITELESGKTLARIADERERSFLIRSVKNLNALAEIIYRGKKRRGEKARAGNKAKATAGNKAKAKKNAPSIRELTMADTLVFLANHRFKDRKIIVWAAGVHLSRNIARLEHFTRRRGWYRLEEGQGQTVGHLVRGRVDGRFFVVNFLAYQGSYRLIGGKEWPVRQPPPESLDDLLHRTGRPYLFLDLAASKRAGGGWLEGIQVARPFGYSRDRGNWPLVCDAFFFIDRMTPCAEWTNKK